MERRFLDARGRNRRRNPKRRIIVYCEGRNTEPIYLGQFNKHFGANLLKMEIVRGVGAPKTITARSISRQRELQNSKDSFERYDEVWACFDRDQRDDADNCVKQCIRAGVKVAFSSPCIEIWAIIHFQNPLSHVVLNSDEAAALLSALMPRYDRHGKKTFDFELMLPHYDRACLNAKLLSERRAEEGVPWSSPMTTFYQLTQRLKTP